MAKRPAATQRHKGKKAFRRHSAPGAEPGLIRVDPEAPRTHIRVLSYGQDELEEIEVRDVEALAAIAGRRPVTWIDVEGLGDADALARIGALFGLHPLAMEDVVNVHQRPKVDTYADHLFIVARMLTHGEAGVDGEQVSLFLGRNVVLTFQERPGDCLDPVRARIRRPQSSIRRQGADHLAYAVLDALIDGYFPVLESLGDRMEELEDEILRSPSTDDVAAVHRVKRDLLAVRRAAWPLRDALNSLIRDPGDLVGPETRVFLRDCYDHCVQVIDTLETYREIASGLMDAYMSAVSHRMNEVMKVLTLIATIFIPLTFVAGVYGMNFDTSSPWNMPELRWKYGYVAFWGLIAATTVTMVLVFRSRGWIERRAFRRRHARPAER
jgi:magnesium transporter